MSSTLLVIASSLVTFPIVIAGAGPEAWASFAVSQSVAAVFGVFVGFGWSVFGPAQVASLTPQERGSYFADSLAVRCVLFAIALAPYSAVVLILTQDTVGWAALPVGLATLIGFVASPWFYVGEANARRFLVWGTLPIVIGSLAAALSFAATGSLPVYVLLVLAFSVAACVLQSVNISTRYPASGWTFSLRTLRTRLREGRSAVVVASTAALYVNSPLVILSLVFPSALPTYALADRLLRYTRSLLSSVAQVAQGYIPASPGAAWKARAKRGLVLAASFGGVSALAFATLVPPAGYLLSAGEIEVPLSVSAPLAVSLFAVALSSVLGLSILAYLRELRLVAVSTSFGAVVGVPTAALLGYSFGASGIAVAVAIAETVVLLVQVLGILRKSRVSKLTTVPGQGEQPGLQSGFGHGRRVIVWRNEVINPSETFIRHQTDALVGWDARLCGLQRVPSTLSRSSDMIAYSASRLDRILSRAASWTARSRRVRVLLRDWHPDVLHAHFAQSGWAIHKEALRLGIPMVLTVHGYDVTAWPQARGWKGRLNRARIRSTFDASSRIIAVSNHIKARAISLGADPEKVIVLHTGVPLSIGAETPQLSRTDATWDIAFVGRMVEKKGGMDLLHAVELCQDLDLRVAIVGEGPLEQTLREFSAAKGLRVDFLGHRDPPGVQSVLARSKVLVVPSRAAASGDTEGLPTVVLEGMAAALPVVASHHAGIPEAVLHRSTGLLFEEGNVFELAACIRTLASSENLRKRMGASGRARAESDFDIRRKSAELGQIYALVVREAGGLSRAQVGEPTPGEEGP